MITALSDIIDFSACPVSNPLFARQCAARLASDGILTLPSFLQSGAVDMLVAEAEAQKHNAYFTASSHNVYLSEPRPDLDASHVFNRQIISSKGCITTDQVPEQSRLKIIYDAPEFRKFIATIVGEPALYEYADPLSSINVHYADEGQELGWHFDNSEFAITLLLQAPQSGGQFEYVRDLRDAEAGEMNFAGVAAVLDGEAVIERPTVTQGTLMLFRGRNAMHRVTPTIGRMTRILVVLAYNAEPGIALSEAARMTFFGRLG
jgi:hypothetical protein